MIDPNEYKDQENKESGTALVPSELHILVTDADTNGYEISKMSDFMGLYAQQLTRSLAESPFVEVVSNIPVAELGIINDVVQHAAVVARGNITLVQHYRVNHEMDTIPECILLRSDGIIGRMMKVSVGFFGTENLHVIAIRLRYDIVCALTKSMSVSMGGKSGRLLFTFSFFSDFATIVVDSGCPFSFISVSRDSTPTNTNVLFFSTGGSAWVSSPP